MVPWEVTFLSERVIRGGILHPFGRTGEFIISLNSLGASILRKGSWRIIRIGSVGWITWRAGGRKAKPGGRPFLKPWVNLRRPGGRPGENKALGANLGFPGGYFRAIFTGRPGGKGKATLGQGLGSTKGGAGEQPRWG